jgi:hypothetical protein
MALPSPLIWVFNSGLLKNDDVLECKHKQFKGVLNERAY